MQKLFIIALIAFSATAVHVFQRQEMLENGFTATIDDIQMIFDHYGQDFSRLPIFQDNLKRIVAHNADTTQSWKQGINQFTFYTEAEFMATLSLPQNCSAMSYGPKRKFAVNPVSIDWRDYDVVTAVKDQGSCGSCWAFSTIASVEAQYAMRDGIHLDLAEQQLVDCDRLGDNAGCKGGIPSAAFEYIMYNGGIEDGRTYPYTARDETCKSDASRYVAFVPGGSYNITYKDEQEMEDVVGNMGPVSLGYQVRGSFNQYKSGVYSDPNCGTEEYHVNHAVLAAGYGTEGGKDYWLCKNSWGAGWGDNGYFKIEKGVNMCALSTCNAFALI